MQIQNALITGSFSYNGADLSNITSSNAYSASLSIRTTDLESTSSVLVGASSSFSSILTSVSSSQQQISASLLTLTASYNALSSSYTALSASYNTASSSFSTRITSDSSSMSSRTTQVEKTYASTGSNTFTGLQNFSNTCTPNSFTAGASIYTAGGLQVTQDSYFSSSVFIKGNVTVFGTQSVSYISSSQLDIGTNIITVNTSTPSVRYGGLSVFDSGSTGLTGSIFWDSELNRWIYVNASGSGGGATYGGGMFISGPRNSVGLGCEQGTTACMLLVGQGGDHMTSSLVYHDSTVTCIPNTLIGSTICTTMANARCIGIGTTTPSALFHTAKSSSGEVARFSAPNGSIPYIILGRPDVATEGMKLTYDSTNGDTSFETVAAHNILFKNNNIERMRITGAGNVGIGTCSPGRTLEVSKTAGVDFGLTSVTSGTAEAIFKGYASGTNIDATTSRGTALNLINLDTTNGNANAIVFHNSNQLATSYIVGVNVNHTSRTGDLIFGTSNAAAPTERMRITNCGLVQINHTNTAKGNLDVASDVNAVPLVIRGRSADGEGQVEFWNYAGSTRYGVLGSTSNYSYFGSIANTPLFFQTNSTERLRITSAGCIGIGNTAPTYQLDMCSGTTVNQRLRLQRGSDDTNQNMLLGWNNITLTRSNVTIAGNQTDFSIIQCGSDGTRTPFYIGVSGNACFSCGISTGVTGCNMIFTQDAAGGYIENFGNTSTKSVIRIQTSKCSNLADYSQFIIDPFNGFGFRALNGGSTNVGIGTLTPSYRLEIQKTNAQTPGIFVNQCSADEATIRFKSTHSCLSDFRIGASILVGSAFEIYNVQCNRTNYLVNCLGYSKMSPDGTFVNGNNTLYHSMDSINDVVLYAYNRSAAGNGILSNVQSCNTSYWSFRGFSDPYGDMAFIYSNGTFGSRTGTYGGIVSDARCKTEICDASSQWSDIKNLRVRNFKLIEDVENDPINAMRQIGFIAQEVETISPGLVFESGNGCVDSGCWKNVKTSIIHTKAVKALQEAMCRIEILESCLGIA